MRHVLFLFLLFAAPAWAQGGISGNNGGISGNNGALSTITDGTNTVGGVQRLTVTGLTVGGTTPNATLTVNPGTQSNISAAGTTQGTATPITAQQTIVTTVAAGAGVILNNVLSVPQTIYSRGNNQLIVYPFSGAQIESYGVNVGVAIAVGGSATFRCVSITQCYAGL